VSCGYPPLSTTNLPAQIPKTESDNARLQDILLGTAGEGTYVPVACLPQCRGEEERKRREEESNHARHLTLFGLCQLTSSFVALLQSFRISRTSHSSRLAFLNISFARFAAAAAATAALAPRRNTSFECVQGQRQREEEKRGE
jgi:hypothetical protein